MDTAKPGNAPMQGHCSSLAHSDLFPSTAYNRTLKIQFRLSPHRPTTLLPFGSGSIPTARIGRLSFSERPAEMLSPVFRLSILLERGNEKLEG
jgi:hypothetical protein